MPPGVALRIGRTAREPNPVSTDVAGFVGRTRRGPVGVPVRVEEWPGFVSAFGDLDPDAPLAYAARGYFESGGKVAVVVRAAGDPNRPADSPTPAAATWKVWPPEGDDGGRFAANAGFPAITFGVTAAEPGDWANGGLVRIEYDRDGLTSRARVREPLVSITVEIDGEPVESLVGLPTDTVVKEVEARSRFIRLTPVPGRLAGRRDPARTPRRVVFKALELGTGWDGVTSSAGYAEGVQQLCDVPEVALVVLPGLYDEVPSVQIPGLLQGVIDAVAATQDRLLILNPPRTEEQARALGKAEPDPTETPVGVESLTRFADAVRAWAGSEAAQSAVAVYHPWVLVADPLGPPSRPLRAVPPGGHAAGVVSRLDRERGAGVTPANAPLYDALDTDAVVPRADADALYRAGVNGVRAEPGRGLILWGGRTLARGRTNLFLAHRRFAHRLVRVLRAVAAPLVFEPNRPPLTKLLTRAASAVLADAYRGGVLGGATADEAYTVTADPAADPADGTARVEIAVALAAPMESITLVVTLNEDGLLEVFDP